MSHSPGDERKVWLPVEVWSPIGYLATYYASTTYFNHTDWLGTVRAHSNVSGGTAEGYTSLPFGDALSSIGLSPIHFTGKERDSESNLDHFWFRQYSSTQGRWMSPDPAGMAAVDITNPQTWNRYAYVANNPVMATDPLGLWDGMPYSLGPGYTLDGQGILDPTWIPWLRNMLRSGAAVYCPDNNCSGIRATDGPNGSTVFEKLAGQTWVDPYDLYFNNPKTGTTTISHTVGHWSWSWQTIGTVNAANNDVRVGMDIWNCPGCAATWRNASGAANTALVGTGVVIVGVPAVATVAGGGFIQTALTTARSVTLNPSVWTAVGDVLSGLAPSLPNFTWYGLGGAVGGYVHDRVTSPGR